MKLLKIIFFLYTAYIFCRQMSMIVLKSFRQVKSTNNATKNWIHGLKEFRKGNLQKKRFTNNFSTRT